MAAASVLGRPAEEFGNDVRYLFISSFPLGVIETDFTVTFYLQTMVEELWAMKAFEHAEIYFNVTHHYT